MRSLLRPVLMAAALLVLPTAAAADWELAADVNLIFPTGPNFDDKVGFGIDGRLGYQFPIPGIALTPELLVGYVNFAEPDRSRLPDASVFRLMGGARLGIGTILRPSVFGHVGYGHLSVTGGESILENPSGLDDNSAFQWDAGVALDLTILPILDVGVHGAYNRLEFDNAVEWWSLGAHVAFLF